MYIIEDFLMRDHKLVTFLAATIRGAISTYASTGQSTAVGGSRECL